MDMVSLVAPRQVTPEAEKKRISCVHDHLRRDRHGGISHSQRCEHDPRNDGPGGAEDEISRSDADRG